MLECNVCTLCVEFDCPIVALCAKRVLSKMAQSGDLAEMNQCDRELIASGARQVKETTEQDDKMPALLGRVVMWGDGFAGKTSLVQSWCNADSSRQDEDTDPKGKRAETEPSPDRPDFSILETVCDGIPVRLQLWDCGGPGMLKNCPSRKAIDRMTRCALKCRVVVLVLDLSDESSPTEARNWVHAFHRQETGTQRLVILGNKTDQRRVSRSEVLDGIGLGGRAHLGVQDDNDPTESGTPQMQKTEYLETSAKFNRGTEAALRRIAAHCTYTLGFDDSRL